MSNNGENNHNQEPNIYESLQKEMKNDFQQNQNYQDGMYNGKPLYQTDPVMQESSTHKKDKKPKSFMGGLFGGIVGAGIISAGIIYGINAGWIGDQEARPTLQGDAGTNNTSTTTPLTTKQIETQTTQVVKKVSDSVVGIVNIQQANQNFFFGGMPQQQQQNGRELEAGIGSGVIYKKEGNYAYVVTNHHVVNGATKLDVSLSDGTRIEAELVGSDVYTDLAVLRIPADKVTNVATFGTSSNIQVGEPSIAIGNPLDLTFAGSVTQGIISGVERTVDVDLDDNGTKDWQAEVLQTDAAINPGNSGGALVNLNGEVIGINSMKINQTSVEGIGFAIPIDIAKPIIESLEKNGEVIRPYMGITLRSVGELNQYQQQSVLKLPESVTSGVALVTVAENSPAEKSGLKAYDVIYEMNGTKIDTIIDLRKVLYKHKAGDEITIKYYREGKAASTKMELVASK